jgi:phage tail sheath protein FI
MPFQVSPGVNVTEIDLTTVVPAVSTTEGAIAGVFRWGPVDKRILVDSETTLVNRFGKPTSFNAETFFTAANFLSYGNKLYTVRTGKTDANTLSLTVSGSPTTNATHTNVVFTTSAATIAPQGTILFSNNREFTVASVSTNNVSILGNVASSFSAAQPVFIQDTQAVYSAFANAGVVANVGVFELATIKNDDTANSTHFADGGNLRYVARYPGELGNSLKVSVCDSTDAFFSNISLVASANNVDPSGANTGVSVVTGSSNVVVQITNLGTGTPVDAQAGIESIIAKLQAGDLIEVGNSSIGTQILKIGAISGFSTSGNSTIATVSFTITTTTPVSLTANVNAGTVANVETVASGYVKKYWEYYNVVSGTPGTSSYVSQFGNTTAKDEIHVVVVDEDGLFTGVPGTILEAYDGLSRATDAKTQDGASLYVKDVINTNSKYVYYAVDRASGYTNTALNIESYTGSTKAMTLSFNAGKDGSNESTVSMSVLGTGYDMFKSAEDVDVSLILQGKARGSNNTQLAKYIIDNVVDQRKDCVLFVSPHKEAVVQNSSADEADDIVAFRNNFTSTSYAVIDSGYKYQYDKYNDIYRFIPLNGDVAGLCVRTDDTRDPWFSPAGFNRGNIKNIVKLAYNPNKAQRDVLYKNGINPVVTFPGQGTVLFGDKTALSKPSAFDRINVRRLFIVLEKAIATAAKFTLFEFNDEFTRSQFKNLVEPFLRDVQGRRGIYDFRVVCDETNNTPEVIDRNEFVGDIYIKPAKSINFIQLNFVAVRTGVEFSEIVGQF